MGREDGVNEEDSSLENARSQAGGATRFAPLSPSFGASGGSSLSP